jgi:hypothetical protein
VEITTTDTKQSQRSVEKSLQVNSTQFATIEIEGWRSSCALRGFCFGYPERRPKILIPKNFPAKSLESIFCSHTPAATF